MDHLREHGGNVYQALVSLDFSINLNPLGLSKHIIDAAKAACESSAAYPDPELLGLRKKLSKLQGISPEQYVFGNGAAELIYRIISVIRPCKALIPIPTFTEYERACHVYGCQVVQVQKPDGQSCHNWIRELANQIQTDTQLLFLCNPNNPDGSLIAREELLWLLDYSKTCRTTVVVDECFMEFTSDPEANSLLSFTEQYPNLILLRAFTKTFAMAGFRLGYAVCSDQALIRSLAESGQPWNVSIPAQQAGIAALDEVSELERMRSLITSEREILRKDLTENGFLVYPSQANYLMFYRQGEDALAKKLLTRGIMIRDCSNYPGLGVGYYRIGIKTKEQNQVLIKALKELSR